MNWFLIVNTILTASASAWYFCNDSPKMGCLNIAFTMSNLVFIWMGKI